MGLRNRLEREGATAPGGVADEEVGFYRRRLLDGVDLGELSALDPQQRRARLQRMVADIISREGPLRSTSQRSALITRVVDAALGLGVLEPLLADESVTEIMINGPSEVWVERAGRLERAGVTFTDEAELRQTVDRIVAGVNRRVDESSPMVDARLPTGERVNVILPPLSLLGPVVTIRRFPRPYSMAELVALGSLDEPAVALLRAVVLARCNVLISGGTGTGKTTFLNAMSGLIPAHERIVTIEDAAELSLQQPHVIPLEARPANVEGRNQVTIRDLVRNSLRMRPDRIIVGEVRGGETLDMLQAMNTGHEGSLATVHANSAHDALLRLETLGSMSELPIAFEAIRDQINGAIEVIVHLRRAADGRRHVDEVAALVSEHRDEYRLVPLAVHDASRPSHLPGRRGGLVRHPAPPALRERLARAGIDLEEVA